jgi:hypothetical protein
MGRMADLCLYRVRRSGGRDLEIGGSLDWSMGSRAILRERAKGWDLISNLSL